MAKKEGRTGGRETRDFDFDPDRKTMAGYGEWTAHGAKGALEEKDDASLKSAKLFREAGAAGGPAHGSAGSGDPATDPHGYERKELYAFLPAALLTNLRAQKKKIEFEGPHTPVYSKDGDLNTRIRRGLSAHDSKSGEEGFNDEFDI